MKRKTNLFYTSGPDSKFLTFSNYTESLTGNFISTDHKLFPSKFLCLNIDNLTDITKPSFIKLLSAYYENKMAVLRDDAIYKDQNIEENALPLAYLVECLIHIEFDKESQEFIWNDADIETILEQNPNKKEMFNYVGDVSEEDYDGTYSDIICYIDLNVYNKASIEYILDQNTDNSVINTTNVIEDTNNLYGWTCSEMTQAGSVKHGDIIDIYDNIYQGTPGDLSISQEAVKPIFDVHSGEECYYNYTSILKSLTVKKHNNKFTASEAAYYNKRLPGAVRAGDIKLNEDGTLNVETARENFVEFMIHDKQNTVYNTYTEREAREYNASLPGAVKAGDENTAPTLVFNAIIPLYDLVNINYKANTTNIVDNIESIDLQKSVSNTPYNHNVPLGIWLSTTPVELEVDRDTLMSPTWSLLISSQFKALPYYSKNLFDEGIENKKILESSNSKMYNTFASVMVRQNQLIDLFTKMQSQIIDLQKRLELVQNQISLIGTNKNIDSLHLEQANFELDLRNEFNEFKDEVRDYFKNLTWKATI